MSNPKKKSKQTIAEEEQEIFNLKRGIGGVPKLMDSPDIEVRKKAMLAARDYYEKKKKNMFSR